MAYVVNMSARARRDVAEIYKWIKADDFDAALKWYRGFRQAILSLAEQPNRCPVTPENHKLRHLLYGNNLTSTAQYIVWWRSRNTWTCSTSATVRGVDLGDPNWHDLVSDEA